MKYPLLTCIALTLLLSTVFAPGLSLALLALSVAAAMPVWETLFGAERPAGAVDETNVVGFRIRYADGTTADSVGAGDMFIAWTLKGSTGIVAVVFFLADQHDFRNAAGQMVRENYVNLFAHEMNFWFVDGTLYGAGSDVPLGLPLGAVKAGAEAPTTDQEATDRMEIYNAALADRVYG